MEGRNPFLVSIGRRDSKVAAVLILAAAVISAAIIAYPVLFPATRPSEWIVAPLSADGYEGSVSPDVPIVAFGSAAFHGPFAVEVTTSGGPVDLVLNVNGEPALRARAHGIAYVYPFETNAGKALSIDLFLSLPPSATTTKVSIGFLTPKASPALTFRSASLSPAAPPDRLFPLRALRGAFSATGHSNPASTLGLDSHAFSQDSTACWGFSSFAARGYAWANVTVPEDVRYYYEIQSAEAWPPYLVMGDVEGSTMNHLHWTAGAFDVQAIVCKPTTAANFEVAVEGPM